MDLPSPDPAKLLAFWMEWEKGETTPGQVMTNLKNEGLRPIPEQLAGCRLLMATAEHHG